MKRLLVLLLLFSCSPDTSVNIKSVTTIANVDSVLAVLDSLSNVRQALPDPTTNAAKRIYTEELFKYRMIDSLTVIYPLLQGKPNSAKLALLNTEIGKFVHPDSTDDRGRATRSRTLIWLQLPLSERKDRIDRSRFIGKLVYASRNQLIAVVEQFNYAMFDGRPLRQVIKKIAIGRLYEGQGNTFTGFIFENTTQFDNKLTMLRGLYFESEIK